MYNKDDLGILEELAAEIGGFSFWFEDSCYKINLNEYIQKALEATDYKGYCQFLKSNPFSYTRQMGESFGHYIQFFESQYTRFSKDYIISKILLEFIGILRRTQEIFHENETLAYYNKNEEPTIHWEWAIESYIEILRHAIGYISNNIIDRCCELSEQLYFISQVERHKSSLLSSSLEDLKTECNKISATSLSSKMLKSIISTLLQSPVSFEVFAEQNGYARSGTLRSAFSALKKLGYLEQKNDDAKWLIIPAKKGFLSNCLLES